MEHTWNWKAKFKAIIWPAPGFLDSEQKGTLISALALPCSESGFALPCSESGQYRKIKMDLIFTSLNFLKFLLNGPHIHKSEKEQVGKARWIKLRAKIWGRGERRWGWGGGGGGGGTRKYLKGGPRSNQVSVRRTTTVSLFSLSLAGFSDRLPFSETKCSAHPSGRES